MCVPRTHMKLKNAIKRFRTVIERLYAKGRWTLKYDKLRLRTTQGDGHGSKSLSSLQIFSISYLKRHLENVLNFFFNLQPLKKKHRTPLVHFNKKKKRRNIVSFINKWLQLITVNYLISEISIKKYQFINCI